MNNDWYCSWIVFCLLSTCDSWARELFINSDWCYNLDSLQTLLDSTSHYSEQYLQTEYYSWTAPVTVYEQFPHSAVTRKQKTRYYSWTVKVTIHEQYLKLLFRSTVCFQWKRFSPSVKAFHLPEFQQSSEESKAPSSLYKEAQVPFLRGFKNLVISQSKAKYLPSHYNPILVIRWLSPV